MSRLDELKWAAGVTKASIEEADADKRSPLIGQYRALIGEIAELSDESSAPVGEMNGLVILQQEIEKRRQSNPSGVGGSKRRSV